MRIRSGYSFRNSVGNIGDVMHRVKSLGWCAAPISDRASTFGFVKWTKLCKKEGLRPVYGVELAVTGNPGDKRPNFDHWTFFAVDDLAPLHDVVELATGQFRYEPYLTYEQASKAPGLIKIAGHRAQLEFFQPQDRLFLPLGPSTVRGYYKAGKAAGHPFIATSDNRFTNKGDKGLYEVVVGRNAAVQTYPQWILTDDEWRAAVAEVCPEDEADEALDFRDACLGQCKAVLPSAELLKPKRPATLLAMCQKGAKKLGINLKDPVYKARLERELALIKQKEFEDYFYIIADIVQWARARMVVGPARGSSCGSLVCYLLEITTIDPIPYGLIFERFIDINRSDLPDIDIDFNDVKRDIVFKYMEQKYGSDHVARLGTVAMYQPRSAITEAGAALNVPRWRCEAVLESLIERSSGDSRALQKMEDTFNDTPAGRELIENHPEMAIAARMEGHPRHSGQHAAGVILTEKPVKTYVAVDARVGATQCDKKDAEDLNLLKIDALGLTQLSVFEDTLELAGKPLTFLDQIPLDDPAAFEVLNKHQFAGVFQFNGLALQSISKQINVSCLNDIVLITAMARPGALTTGGAHTWVKRHNGVEPVSYPHPSFEPYLRDSLGVVVYQEQVMEIGRNIGGLSWEDVTALRKAMSKSLGAEYFNQFGDRFKEGAIRDHGIPAESLDKLWTDLCAMGAWTFNKSHSVAYGVISYWCAWFKAHHPFEFAAATLTHESDPQKQLLLLRELHKEGITYVPVDAERSTDRWTPAVIDGQRVLVGPLNNVVGLGPKMVSQIMSARSRNEPISGRAAKLLADPRTTLDSLWPIRDAFHRLMPDPRKRNIYSTPTPIESIQPQATEEEYLVFCTPAKINPRDENEAIIVARRGYRIEQGCTTSLNMQLRDDSDVIFGKITRRDFIRIGKDILDRGKPGKALYAMKGKMRANAGFRMLTIDAVRYIGDINDAGIEISFEEQQAEEEQSEQE